MRSNRKLLFGIALILTAFVFWRILAIINAGNNAPITAAAPASSGTVVPVVAPGRIMRSNQNLPAGSLIAPGMFDMVSPSPGQSTAGLVTDPEKQALGFITRTALNKGAFVRPDDFVGHITEVGIAGALRPGSRAMMIPIANKPTLHDLVRIGNFVDVYAAFEGQEARAVVQNVRVLAVDVSANDYPPVNAAMRGPHRALPKGNVPPGAPAPVPGEPAPTPTPEPPPAAAPAPALTLEVSPSQAASLLLVQASGAVFDFLLRPTTVDRTESLLPGGAIADEDLTPVSVTRPQISPYAERLKQAAARPARQPAPAPAPRPVMGPVPVFGTGPTTVPPQPITTVQAPPPATYEIPIYADGKLVRSDTVLRP